MKKRILIPSVFIGAVLAVFIWWAVRGNWADAQPRNPASIDDVVVQLLATAQGQKQIRAAMIVPAPPERVWHVVTDYDHFSEVFPHMGATKGVQDSDGRWHLTGEVRSMIGHWPMDLHVVHKQSSERSVASWDEPSGAWKINRGSWSVTPHGTNGTLLEYNLELKVTPFPDFIVRAVLLDNLKPVLKAVATHSSAR